VGGNPANSTYPAEFIYENLMIDANVIHAAYTPWLINQINHLISYPKQGKPSG